MISTMHYMTALCSSLCILREMFRLVFECPTVTFIIGTCMSGFPATSRVPNGTGKLLQKRLLVPIRFEVLQHRMCTQLRG